jgi:hypothetical protein
MGRGETCPIDLILKPGIQVFRKTKRCGPLCRFREWVRPTEEADQETTSFAVLPKLRTSGFQNKA